MKIQKKVILTKKVSDHKDHITRRTVQLRKKNRNTPYLFQCNLANHFIAFFSYKLLHILPVFGYYVCQHFLQILQSQK